MFAQNINTMVAHIENQKVKRFKILYAVFKATNQDTRNYCEVRDLAAAEGVKNGDFEKNLQYLKDEGLLKSMGAGTLSHITHEGIKAIEFTLSHPDSDSEHFPALNSM